MSPPTNEVRLRVALAEAKASQRCCLRHSMPAGAASRYALGAGGVGAVRPAPAASLISASRYALGAGGVSRLMTRGQGVRDVMRQLTKVGRGLRERRCVPELVVSEDGRITS